MSGTRAGGQESSTSDLRCVDCGAHYVTGFEAWYRGYGPLLRRYVKRKGPFGSLDVDDIVQETFADLHGALAVVENPAGWLRRVADRKVAQAWQERRRWADGDATDHLTAHPTQVWWSSISPTADIETTLAVRALLRAMRLLPDRQRAALYLSQVEGWTHAEIGQRLGCAESTAAVHTHKGRLRLRLMESAPGAEPLLPMLRRTRVDRDRSMVRAGERRCQRLDAGVDLVPLLARQGGATHPPRSHPRLGTAVPCRAAVATCSRATAVQGPPRPAGRSRPDRGPDAGGDHRRQQPGQRRHGPACPIMTAAVTSSTAVRTASPRRTTPGHEPLRRVITR